MINISQKSHNSVKMIHHFWIWIQLYGLVYRTYTASEEVMLNRATSLLGVQTVTHLTSDSPQLPLENHRVRPGFPSPGFPWSSIRPGFSTPGSGTISSQCPPSGHGSTQRLLVLKVLVIPVIRAPAVSSFSVSCLVAAGDAERLQWSLWLIVVHRWIDADRQETLMVSWCW